MARLAINVASSKDVCSRLKGLVVLNLWPSSVLGRFQWSSFSGRNERRNMKSVSFTLVHWTYDLQVSHVYYYTGWINCLVGVYERWRGSRGFSWGISSESLPSLFIHPTWIIYHPLLIPAPSQLLYSELYPWLCTQTSISMAPLILTNQRLYSSSSPCS